MDTSTPKIKEEMSPIEQETEGFQAWIRGTCRYTCSLCKNVSDFGDSEKFSKHLTSFHLMTNEDYVIFVGDPCSQETLLGCQLCGQNIRHDNPTMTNHFENGHKISLTDYFNRFLDDDGKQMSCSSISALKWACGCTYQCQFCNSKFGTQQHFQTHLEEKHKKLDLELEPFTSTIFACNICAFVGHKDPSIVSKHVGDVHNLSLEEYFANHVEASNKTSNSQFDDKIDFDDTYSSTDTGLGTSIKQESTAIDNSLISNQVEVEEEINCDQTTDR